MSGATWCGPFAVEQSSWPHDLAPLLGVVRACRCAARGALSDEAGEQFRLLLLDLAVDGPAQPPAHQFVGQVRHQGHRRGDVDARTAGVPTQQVPDLVQQDVLLVVLVEYM